MFRISHLARSLGTILLLTLLLASPLSAQTPHYTVYGTSDYPYFGFTLEAVGDVNADGKTDFAATSHRSNSQQAGAVRILSGADGSVLVTLLGSSPHDYFGWSLSVGDLNSDGVLDLVVGAPEDGISGYHGYVRALQGPAFQQVLFTLTGATDVQFGFAVAIIPDITGDGNNDLAVGERFGNAFPQNAGLVRLFSGATAQELPDPILTVNGPGSSLPTTAGWLNVVGMEDVNGDGRGEIVVSAGALSGYAYVNAYSGANRSLLYTFAPGTGGPFEQTLRRIGDINADGHSDLIYGTPYNGPNNGGVAYVISGTNGAMLHTFHSDGEFDNFAGDADSIGDVNADGTEDIVLSARDNGTTGFGYIKVFSGSTGSLLGTLNHTSTTLSFVRLLGLGDTDGDGIKDLAIGSPNDSTAGTNFGRVQVFGFDQFTSPPFRPPVAVIWEPIRRLLNR